MILESRKNRRIIGVALITALIGFSGCRGAGGNRVTKAEPSLSGSINDDIVVGDSSSVAAPPSRTVGYVDRHPLFSKPREYWDTSGDNKIVKAAAATFIGVPVGFAGEVKQIFVGVPPETRQQ